MAEAVVKLSISDAATTRLRGFAKELKELSSLAKASGAPDAGRLQAGARQLQSVADNFGGAEVQATKASRAFSAAKDSLGAFTSGAGLGFAKNLAGIGGAVAFAAAAGKVIGDSIKLAAEFERVSTRATFSLALGRGNLGAQLKNLQMAAGGYSDLGMNKIEASQMIGTFGQASGATLGQSIGAGRAIGTYSRAMGLDPMEYAAQAGMIAQLAGKNVGETSGSIFGAAGASGDAGRRVPELLGNVVSLLTTIQGANPFGKDGLKSALSEIVGISRLGGYFQSSAGMQTAMSGISALGGGIGSSPYMTNLALRSGMNLEDIQFGVQDIGKISKISRQLYKESGGSRALIGQNIAAIVPGAEGRALTDIIMATQGNLGGKFNPMTQPAAAAAAKAYRNTVTGQLGVAGASVQNAEIGAGDAILKVLAPRLADLGDGIHKLTDAINSMSFGQRMEAVAAGLGIVALAVAGKNGIRLPEWLGGSGGSGTGKGGVTKVPVGASAVEKGGGMLGMLGRGASTLLKGGILFGAAALAGTAIGEGVHVYQQYQELGTLQDEIAAKHRDDSSSSGMTKNGRVDMKRWLYAIRMRENSGKYTGRNGIGAMGAYQFMPETLKGYAKQMDPALYKRLGQHGFEEYFLAHPKMQDRYASDMVQNALASGVKNIHEYGAYHLGGYGGFLNLKKGRGNDPRYGDGYSTLNQEGDAFAQFYANAPQDMITYRAAPSAAKANAAHPGHSHTEHAHQGGGGSSHQKIKVAANGGHIEITAKMVNGNSRTQATTHR